MKYNVLTPVVSIIEATSPDNAIAIAASQLDKLVEVPGSPFSVYEGEGHDAFESDDQS